MSVIFFFFFFKQKTAYEMRISDWSSDVCSSDLSAGLSRQTLGGLAQQFYTGIGQQGVWAAGGLEPMLDEGREAFALDHRLELHLHLDTAMQCGIGRALQGLRQAGVTDQPHGDQVARVEREVEEEIGRAHV